MAKAIETGWPWLWDEGMEDYVGYLKALEVIPTLYSEKPEEKVRWLKQLGYNWIYVVFSVGFALDEEREQRDAVVDLTRICHENGIRVTAYTSLTNIFWKSMFHSNPEARDWVQRDEGGTPKLYGGAPPRYLCCVNNPDYRRYKKEIIRLAIEAGADAINWDNVAHAYCYSRWCAEGFRKYSKKMLGKEHEPPRGVGELIKEYGTQTEDALAREQKGEVSHKAKDPTSERERLRNQIDNPLVALFHDFGCWSMGDALREFKQYAQSLKPDIVFEANSHGVKYVNDTCEVLWTEDASFLVPRLEHEKLYSGSHIYKFYWASGKGKKPVFFQQQGQQQATSYWDIPTPAQLKRCIAEGASHQGHYMPLLGHSFAVQLHYRETKVLGCEQAMRVYNGFLADHEDLYVGTHTIAQVAIYTSHATRFRQGTLGMARKPWEFTGMALLKENIPYDVLVDENIDSEALGNYEVVILPDVCCMSEREIALFSDYVRNGGWIISTHETSLFTELWERRKDYGLRDTFGASFAGDRKASKIVNRSGNGGSIFFPQQFSDHDHDARMNPRDDNMRQELLRAVKDARQNRPFPIEIEAPGFVIASPLRQKKTGRILIHLLNYDDESAPVTDVKIRINDAERLGTAALSQYCEGFVISPDFDGKTVIRPRQGEGCLELIVPRLEIYDLVVLAETQA